MKAILGSLLLAISFSALAQSRTNDPCYAYRPEELERLPPGVCSEVRGGGSRRQEAPGREARQEYRRDSRREESPSHEYSESQRSQAVARARSLQSRAVRESEEQIARGRRVRGANQELLTQATEVVAKLRRARIVDGGDQCAERPTADAYAPYDGDTIHICPPLGQRTGRNGDREIIFILVHEAAHLWGERDEGAADEIAGMILGYVLQ